MVLLRILRTLGNGPPAGLAFGQIAYSNGDKRLHVGRPTPEPPLSFEPPFTQLTLPITPLNGFVFLEGWANELIVISPKLAMVQFGVMRETVPVNVTTMLEWEGYPAAAGTRTGHHASSSDSNGFVGVVGSEIFLLPSGTGSWHYWVGSVLFPLQ